MLFEELIPVIESKTEIWRTGYDLSNNSTASSDKAWEEIAQQFDCNVDTIKNRLESLKTQYRKQLEEENLASGKKSHEHQSKVSLLEIDDSKDVKDNKNENLGGGKSHQDLDEDRSIKVNHKVSVEEGSEGDPDCSTHRLSREGFNVMHFIRDQMSVTPKGEDSSIKSVIKNDSEPEIEQTESSHSLKSEESLTLSENEGSSSPIPSENLGAIKADDIFDWRDYRDEISRLAIEYFHNNLDSLQAFADDLRR